ncbi:MAG TPA: type II toxin-antitoxin system HipA family toxin [Kribbellaceae bacterium]|nr:type II toxin-antitoxin system HipA family toxin [Kribbellaceae bacterium]
MADDRLVVYVDGTRIGLLEQDSRGRVSFGYDEVYRHGRGATPLSLSMPLTSATHPPRVVRAFIAGLLPDSERALERLGRKYGVSPNNPFALLRHIGMDAAGAVQVLPEDVDATDAATRQGHVEWLTDDALESILAGLARSPDTWDPGRDTGRWSLAGAQSKVALHRSSDGRWGVPRDSSPTTHILKPSMPNYDGHHLNEHLCLRAAQLVGLPAAKTEILRNERFEVLISHRYDRRQVGGRWRRLHQEDLCQALAVHPVRKYQSDGGPGIGAIADLFARSMPGTARRENARVMFDYLVYNVAIGAPDAHAKNFSLMLGAGAARLAPLYDVASILPYDVEPGVKSAMKIGDTWELSKISAEDWAAAGARLGLPRDEAVERAADLRSRVPAAMHAAAREEAIPGILRERAAAIAELVTAHVERRRDNWGRTRAAD